ncbi:hypothetical protein PsYK624_102270 [Phanerochaete sordida]|uniref:ASX DEUBAD domain-containing protein n=1 Tax=Phanerochaete sordida TaxID=48140 RepID=A0A9P3LGW3_9APHY|nr:hypothetical protein PsYK624_102270 [Phanerochaete sordida]
MRRRQSTGAAVRRVSRVSRALPLCHHHHRAQHVRRRPQRAPTPLDTRTRTHPHARRTLASEETEAAARPEARLAYLFGDSRSKLAAVDTADVVRYEHFIALSAESQALFCALLPPTASTSFAPRVDSRHPSGARTPATLDPAFLASLHVHGAARAWQENVAAWFFSATSRGAQAPYRAGVRSGEMHAEWTDDAAAHGALRGGRGPRRTREGGRHPRGCRARVRAALPRTRAHRRERHALHKAVAATGALAVLLQPSSAPSLPRALLVLAPSQPEPPTLTVGGALASVDLGDALLDTDERVPMAHRAAPAPG